MDVISHSDAFELHPVSGEIDFGDLEDIRYRRLDEETLQARIALIDLGIVVIYTWCEGDQEGVGNGWRASEVMPTDGEVESSSKSWSLSVAEAGDRAKEKMIDDAIRQGEDHSMVQGTTNGVTIIENSQDNDDDDTEYWAQYDKTPGRTPAVKTPVPSTSLNAHRRSTSEADYFAQYGQVQPEMDNDDPSRDQQAFGESTLNGNQINFSIEQATKVDESQNLESVALPNGSGVEDANGGINQPAASSPRTRSSTISKLEQSAKTQSMTESAITHHVGTSIKSLYRLCRSSGIERSEFDRMIRNEMDTLSMMDEDE